MAVLSESEIDNLVPFQLFVYTGKCDGITMTGVVVQGQLIDIIDDLRQQVEAKDGALRAWLLHGAYTIANGAENSDLFDAAIRLTEAALGQDGETP